MQSNRVIPRRVAEATGVDPWFAIGVDIDEEVRRHLQETGLDVDAIASRQPEFPQLLLSIDGIADCVAPVVRSIGLLGLHDTLTSLESGLEIPGLFDTSEANTLQSRAAERLRLLDSASLRLLRRLAIEGAPVSLATLRELIADVSDAPNHLIHQLLESGWVIRRDNEGSASEYRVRQPLAICVIRETPPEAYRSERQAWLEFSLKSIWTLEYGVQTPANAKTLEWLKPRIKKIERLLDDLRHPLSHREKLLGARFWLVRFQVAGAVDELSRSKEFVARVESLTQAVATEEALDLLVQAEAESVCRASRTGRLEEGGHSLARLSELVLSRPSPTRQVWMDFARTDYQVEDTRNLAQGLEQLAKVVVDAQAVGLTMIAARANMNIGNYYYWLDRHDDAFEHYVKASVQAREVGALRLEAVALVNQPIAVDYARASRADDRRRAIRAGHQAVQYFTELNDPYGVAMAHQALGMAYCGVLQLNLALQNFREAHAGLSLQQNVRQLAFVLNNLAEISMFSGLMEAARTANAQLQELAATQEDDVTRFTAAMADFSVAFHTGQWAFASKRAKDCILALENSDSLRSRIGMARWWLACAQQLAGMEHVDLPADAVADSPMGVTAQIYQALYFALNEDYGHPLVQGILDEWMKRLVTTLHEPENQRGLIDECIGTPVWGAIARLIEALPNHHRQMALDRVVADQRRASHWLLLDVDRMAARCSGGEWTSLQHRAKAFQLLRFLAVRHVRHPEQSVLQDELIQWLWPGEKLVGDSGAGRLHSTFTQLRNLGFRDVIVRLDEGYCLTRGTLAYIWNNALPIEMMVL